MSIDITTLAIAKEYTNRMIGSGGTGSGGSGGYYTPGVTQPTTDTMQISFAPSKPDMPAVNTVTVNLPVSENSGQNVGNADVTSIKTVLGNIMTIIKAQTDSEDGVERPQGYNMDVSGLVAQNDVLISALGGSGDSGGEEEPDTPVIPEKTLTSISATYTGGAVPVGTAVSALTGIVVTAHYSDGSAATVTGYTLSGSIVEGSNTVTVTYGGKTVTVTVVGVAESTGDAAYSPELVWEDGYRIYHVDGSLTEAPEWSVSQLIDISEYSKLRVVTTSETWFSAQVMVGTDDKPRVTLTSGSTYWGGNYMRDETFDITAYHYLRISSTTANAMTFTVKLK